MAKIKNVLVSKILQLLDEWAANDKEKYIKFFNNFGSLLKSGITSDFTNKDKIIELIRFESSLTKENELTSFKEYVIKMKPEQKDIYYVAGDNRLAVDRNPNLEYFKKNGIEVIYLTDPVDLFTIPYIYNYQEKQLKSIDKADLDVQKDNDSNVEKLNEDLSKSLIEVFKETLGGLVEDVRESNRLVDSPATLVVGSQGMDPQMEKMMKMMDKDYTAGKRILEINTSHELIKNLSKINLVNKNDEKLRKCILQIYEGALLLEGYLKSPVDFQQRMIDLMVEATK